jgi:hypothetical protein
MKGMATAKNSDGAFQAGARQAVVHSLLLEEIDLLPYKTA